jgi:hypothetical protein
VGAHVSLLGAQVRTSVHTDRSFKVPKQLLQGDKAVLFRYVGTPILKPQLNNQSDLCRVAQSRRSNSFKTYIACNGGLIRAKNRCMQCWNTIPACKPDRGLSADIHIQHSEQWLSLPNLISPSNDGEVRSNSRCTIRAPIWNEAPILTVLT